MTTLTNNMITSPEVAKLVTPSSEPKKPVVAPKNQNYKKALIAMMEALMKLQQDLLKADYNVQMNHSDMQGIAAKMNAKIQKEVEKKVQEQEAASHHHGFFSSIAHAFSNILGIASVVVGFTMGFAMGGPVGAIIGAAVAGSMTGLSNSGYLDKMFSWIHDPLLRSVAKATFIMATSAAVGSIAGAAATTEEASAAADTAASFRSFATVSQLAAFNPINDFMYGILTKTHACSDAEAKMIAGIVSTVANIMIAFMYAKSAGNVLPKGTKALTMANRLGRGMMILGTLGKTGADMGAGVYQLQLANITEEIAPLQKDSKILDHMNQLASENLEDATKAITSLMKSFEQMNNSFKTFFSAEFMEARKLANTAA
jgi:hypothetical protein